MGESFPLGESSEKSGAHRTPLRMVTDLGGMADAVADLESGMFEGIALDVQVHGGNIDHPRCGEIRVLTLCRRGGTVWMIDIAATGKDLGPIASVLGGARLIVHDACLNLGLLRAKHGLRAVGAVDDTLTASRLLNFGRRADNTLPAALKRHLGVRISDEHENWDWGGMLFDDQTACAAGDVVHLHGLMDALAVELATAKLDGVQHLEAQLVHQVVDMVAAGFAVDTERLLQIQKSSKVMASELQAKIQKKLGSRINLSSPAQLKDALAKAGVRMKSVDNENLQRLQDRNLAEDILAHREAEKCAQQATTFLDAARDGRVHADYDPTGTETGRFSCRNPNLQSVARGELRECFIAPPGRTLVCCDYSQVELCLAASISGDRKMAQAFRDGKDLHVVTASVVLGRPQENISKEDRQLAKAVNFGLLYGQYPKGLVDYARSMFGVSMTEGKAREIRGMFFNAYRGLAQWHEANRRAASDKSVTEVRTLAGRRRLLPDWRSKDDEWKRFTDLVNTPVQGSAADCIKRALVLLHEQLDGGAQIVATVHDEIVIECDESQGPRTLELAKRLMTDAFGEFVGDTPVGVEGNTGPTWGQTKA